MKKYKKDVCIIGGCGHVGLPLALCFADKGLKVNVYDINQETVDMVNNSKMPFLVIFHNQFLKMAFYCY